MAYLIQYRHQDQAGHWASWNNRQYADYREAVVAAIDARDKYRAPGRSWTVSRVERMETFR